MEGDNSNENIEQNNQNEEQQPNQPNENENNLNEQQPQQEANVENAENIPQGEEAQPQQEEMEMNNQQPQEEEIQPQQQQGEENQPEMNNVQDEIPHGPIENQNEGAENQQQQNEEQKEGEQQPANEGQEGTPGEDANKELIFNNDKDFLEVEPLFVDEEGKAKYDTYEVEFIVKDSKDNPRTVIIDLEKIKYNKPYYGGFVNKTNGTYYYHAYAQTDQYKNDHIIKNERSAQTYEYRSLSTKMLREFGTQMSYTGLYIDERQDKFKTPRTYFDSESWEDRKKRTITWLQKMMRGFFARKTCKHLRKERDDEKAEKEKKEEEARQKEEKKNKEEIKRRTHPKTGTDFMLLKQELDEWVKNETIRIKSSDLSDEDKSLALQELLHKEISLLQTIEKLKISANKENRTEQISRFLEKMSADKKWKVYDGHYVSVQTILTATAAGLQKQFQKLVASTTVDQRLANLLEFKQMMNKSNEGKNACTLIAKILDLIDRESTLLERGRPDSSLEGLRQRLNNLYLNYIETPEFNPEAQRFQIIPKNYLKDMFKGPKE